MKFTSTKLLSFLSLLFFSLLSYAGYTQAPGIKWTRSIDHSANSDFIYDIKKANNGTYVAVGSDSSWNYFNGYITSKLNGEIAFIQKLDTGGRVLWRYPYAYQRGGFTEVVISGNDYVAAGYRSLTVPPYDTSDFFLVKVNSEGTKLWEKTYRGSNIERAYSVNTTSAGGYILAGFTNSNNLDVSGSHGIPGISDAWVVKTNAVGDIIWTKCYGGSFHDTAFSVVETIDKGFVIAGASRSIDGDLAGNFGLSDGWIFKIDSSGNILWRHNLGGSGNDAFKKVIANADGGYTAIGYTSSSAAASNGNKGGFDTWVVRLSADGTVVWSKTFGGSGNEAGFSIVRTQDDGFLASGFTESNNGDVNGNNGLSDTWIFKISGAGDLVWQKCAGTPDYEYSYAIAYETEIESVSVGFTRSNVSGLSDGYVVKLGSANTIKASLFFDANSNGVKDNGEGSFLGQVKVTLQKEGVDYRQLIPREGEFRTDVDLGNYSTTVQASLPYYTVVSPIRSSAFSTYFNVDSFSFAIQPVSVVQDLIMQIIPLNTARPGFSVDYKLVFKNNGTVSIPAGSVAFKPDSRLSFTSAIPSITSSNLDTLKWDYSNFSPTESREIFVKFQASTSILFHDTLNHLAIVTPVTGDVTPSDDTAYLRQRVFASYDPNDKDESNAGIISPQFVSNGKYLNYLIRFQNVGNDTAFTVIIRDTLDNKLDWNTFEIVDASHALNVQINDGNKVAFNFPDINLPDSNINEPASHGFIAYRIKPLLSVATGDIITNTASIYFDYNLPVVTNTVTTQVVSSFSTLPLHLISFTGTYKAPEAQLRWSTQGEYNVSRFEIERSVDGIHFQKTGEKKALAAGNANTYDYYENITGVIQSVLYYRLKMLDIDGRFTYSAVVPVRIADGKVDVIVFPNPVANGAIRVMINAAQKEEVEIRVIDNVGKVLRRQRNSIYSGINTINIAEGISVPGAYYLQITGAHTNAVIRFIIP